MYDLIMVEKPYNILRDVVFNPDGTVEAIIKNEYLYELESGPIGCSEFGRHIAILGSIAIAKSFGHKDKHYYLAIHADLKRKSNNSESSSIYRLKTKALETKKRTGRIYGEIRDENNTIIYSGEVAYQAIAQPIFSKLYAKHRVEDVVPKAVSPYIERRKLMDLQINGETISGDYGKVIANECEGHFNDFPALPVAIIGGLFGELSMPLFKYHYPNLSKILSTKVVINAFRLAFTGEHVTFEGRIDKHLPGDTIRVIAQAKVGDEVIADANFELKAVYSKESVEMMVL